MMTAVRRRISLYLNLILASVVLGLVPAVLEPDLKVSAPEALDRRVIVEKRLFQALVVPPSYSAEIFGRARTGYATLALSGSTDGWDTLPLPSGVALEHLAGAVPFWFLLLSLAAELTRLSIRRMREADQREHARFRLQQTW